MLKRMLLTGRLEGRTAALPKLATLARERKASAVLFAGGFLDGGTTGPGQKLRQLQAVLDELGDLGVFTAAIPGVADAPLREFLGLATIAELAHPHLHVVHATLWTEGDVALCGLDGELTETEDRAEDRVCYSRAPAEYFLRTCWRARQPHRVLLLNVPPPGPLSGDGGNRICGDFIDTYHPSLCVVAGATEHQGFQQIAHTLVVNPGRLADGAVGWLEWGRKEGAAVEFLRL